ncbi:MAG: hypothetical protein U0T84_11645 [Chitinophagales bacterium]
MKTKNIVLGAALLFTSTAFSQIASADVSMTEENNPTELTRPAAPAPMAKKEVVVQLRNNCEHTIAVYSGDKKEVFSGKGKLLGGLSNNQLFLLEGDVVCIMKDQKNIQACSIIKPETTQVAINQSGNGFIK